MRPRRGRLAPRNPPRADFVGIGFAAVLTAVPFLTLSTVGGGGGEGPAPPVHGAEQWQIVLAFALLAGGLLSVMYGMRLRDPRAPPFVRHAADTATAVLGNAGGPERLLPLPLMIMLLCPLLEAWYDFI